MQGDYNIQGGPLSGGGGAAGTPVDLNWQNLSARLGTAINPFVPTHDTKGMFTSGSSDATGTLVNWTPQAGSNLRANMIQFDAGLVSALFPEWTDPVHQFLYIRYTSITVPDRVADSVFGCSMPAAAAYNTIYADGVALEWSNNANANPVGACQYSAVVVYAGQGVLVGGTTVAAFSLYSGYAKPDYIWQHDSSTPTNFSNPLRSYAATACRFSVDIGAVNAGAASTSKVLLEFAISDVSL